MRKTIAIVLCIILVLSFSACSSERPDNITTEDSTGTLPDSVTYIDDGVWPENEYTRDIPTPPGVVGWVMLDPEQGTCTIQVGDVTKSQFDSYYDKLLDSGFGEIEKVQEEVDGQGYISIGTILSDGTRSMSLAYAEPVLVMTIVGRGVDGTGLGFLQSGNLTNVYVSAYSTYDAEDGVQVVTELYVPEGESPRPAFTMVNGIVTVTLGTSTTTHALCSASGREALSVAVSTGLLGTSGEKGTVVIAGTAYADNAAAGCGSFGITYDITIP